MPVSCMCCSLFTGCICASLFTMFLYFLTLSLELWWIIEAKVQLPLVSYLLTLIYFCLSILSVVTMIGLRAKKARFLLTWMLFYLLCVLPEAGIVLYLTFGHWNGGFHAIMELTLWVIRALISIIGTISLYYLYNQWKDEKSVLRSLNDLSATNEGFHPNGISGEYQQKRLHSSMLDLHQQQPHMAITTYSGGAKNLKRTSSLASSKFVSASRLSLADLGPQQFAHMPISDQNQFASLHRRRGNGYSENEFDTAKFTSSNLSYGNPMLTGRSISHFDLASQNFGLDPDAPVFMQPGTYGAGGLPLPVARTEKEAPFRLKYLAAKRKKAKEGQQWYKPRSLVNLSEDVDVWDNDYFQDLMDQHRSNLLMHRSHSMGALNLGFIHDDLDHQDIVRSQVGPYNYYRNEIRGESKISLGQVSDHVDKYRDVAL